MIINVDHIRKGRPVSLNIDEIKRLEPYIIEAERLWVMPALTPELYYKIEQSVLMDNNERPIVSNFNEPILFTHLGDYELLICGGYYDDNKRYVVGLISAVSYLAYSRMIMQNQINVTAYGVVFKQGDLSEPVDGATLVRASKEAEKIGREYLQQCVNYIQFADLDDVLTAEIPRVRKKFKAIGTPTSDQYLYNHRCVRHS